MGKGLLVLFLLGTCCSFVITNESSSSQEDQDVSGDDEDLSSGSGSEEILDFDDTNINVPSTAVSPSMSIFGQETTIFGRELVKEIKPVLVDPKPVVESTSHEPSTHSPTTHRPVTAKFTTVKMERSNGHIDSIHHPHHHHHHHHPHHHNTTTANPHTAADFNMPHEDTSEHPLVVVVDSHLHHILLEETTTLEPNLGKSDVQEIIDALTTEEPKNIDLIDDQIPEEGTPSGSSSTTYTEYAETTEDPSDAGGFHVVFGPDQNSTTKPSLPGVDYVATSIVPHKEKTDEEVDLVSEYITPESVHKHHHHSHHHPHHHTTTQATTTTKTQGSTSNEMHGIDNLAPKGRKAHGTAITSTVPVLDEDVNIPDEQVDLTTSSPKDNLPFNISLPEENDLDRSDSKEEGSGEDRVRDEFFFEHPDIAKTIYPIHRHNNVHETDNGKKELFENEGSSGASHGIMERKEVLAGIIAGGVAGLAFAVFLVGFMLYRMKKKDEGSYSLEEPKQSNGGYQKPREQREFYA